MGHSDILIRQLSRPGDFGWVVMAHGELYAREFGWDTSFEALVARVVADYATAHDVERENAWIAESDERRVGCIFCVRIDEKTAQLRTLLVDPSQRGQGLGARLVDTCLAFARQVGYSQMRLWTNHPLTSARQLYLSRGFRLVKEAPHHSFGTDLNGQVYELDLRV